MLVEINTVFKWDNAPNTKKAQKILEKRAIELINQATSRGLTHGNLFTTRNGVEYRGTWEQKIIRM